MKRVYFLFFVLSTLVFSACCSNWFIQNQKDNKTCECKEFEKYIKSWKVDKETGVFFINRTHEDKESELKMYNLFLKRLDCLKGKKVGYARKLFKGKADEIHITIPKSKECLDCYVKRGECKYKLGNIVHCYHLEIQISDDDEKTITSTSEDLDAVTRKHYVWLYVK